MSFGRTDLGKINKYIFYQDPVVWIEGIYDIPFYEHSLTRDPCILLSAGGKNECIKLADAIRKYNLPYVVIMDGDYKILSRRKSDHRWIISLDRNSIENYLFEKNLAQHICYDYICLKTGDKLSSTTELDKLNRRIGDNFDKLMSYVKSRLFELIIIDIANCIKATGCDVLPDRIDPLCRSGNAVIFLDDQIARCCNKGKNEVNQEEIDHAIGLVSNCLKYKRFIHIVPGHLVYGILRRFIKNNIKQNTGKSITIDDEGLMLLLASKVWTVVEDRDHKELKRRLRKALSEVKAVRQSSLSRGR